MAEERVAIVVGSSSGMGKATAVAYASAGMRVVLAARSEDKLNAVAKEIGDRASVSPVDVTDPASVNEMVKSVMKAHGRIDILVYATGTNITNRRLE